MDLSTKNGDMIENLTALGVGVAAWMQTSTAKFNNVANQGPSVAGALNYPLKTRFEDALANTFGRSTVHQFDPKYGVGGGGYFQPALFGWANKTVGAGVLLGIADYIAQEVYPPYTKKFEVIHRIAIGATEGLIIGGAIGGIFDPDPAGNRGTDPTKPYNAGSPSSVNYIDAVVQANRSV